ncbi:FadR/GntR family transcriptional regulator [Cupriavidus taiwanensis]|uniref:Putative TRANSCRIPTIONAL REGULATOR, GntR family n=1 Tax=Cupriavidus taiwanensis TaxID=164546 RepID=A0A7Z7JBV6_9BURK|nr:FadR/GntR family transcriptional regulator [Cupriavidus taiwanensis]SOZ09401.1 putative TRANSCRIPTIONAL REGULATOR, GntR family [Cupriavidus taiwanensis]SOZ11525.1 putative TRANSCRIPTIONAL REGULATOR, GntR family [Cupriavidus taiwanensis]SOZ42880.1 putative TRANSCRIPTIONAL REGULATOR, GntR family [Cupriavidus taiwanensis]SPC22127.1 putative TRANSCRIPTIONAL REGULATOR, GntR family [Cupriavidus taiwanensis]SPD53630.1 putative TRANSCRIPTIONAL REGULATOR, GntR family [Cupriavidus taiwanensis]
MPNAQPLAPSSSPTSSPAPLRRRGRTLAEEVVQALGEDIRQGQLKPGDKLPTESEIMATMGVSRTVVREALSRLQASGLVETRHGIGTFVLERPAEAPSPFRIGPDALGTAMDVMAMLEFRVSVEAEAAGLAAARRTDAQLAAMRQALDELKHGADAGNDAVESDFAFHLAIARATGNRYFTDLMGHLGTMVIPRSRLQVNTPERVQYLERVSIEHENIYDAIERRDPDAAKAAMRMHLTNSRERLRKASGSASPQG